MNCKKEKYSSFKNYWKEKDIKEEYFVSYAIRGCSILPNLENKISNSPHTGVC
jgi:hypothetical protein